MGNITEFTNPDAQRGLEIPTQGASAWEQAGYHVERIARQVGADAHDMLSNMETHEQMDQITAHGNALQSLDAQVNGDGPGSWNEAKANGTSADDYIKQTVQPGLDALDEGITNKRARFAAVQTRNATLLSYTNRFHAEQNQIDGDAAADTAQGFIDNGRKAVMGDPASLPAQINAVSTQVGAIHFLANQPPAARAKLTKSIASTLAQDAGEGIMLKAESPTASPTDIQNAQKWITDPNGAIYKNASPEKMFEWQQRLEKAHSTAGAVQGYEAEQQLGDVNKAIRETGPTPELLARQSQLTPLVQGTTPVETAKAQFKAGRENESAVSYGNATRDVMTAPSTELKPAADAIQAAISKETDPDRLRTLEAQQSAVHDATARRDKEYNADPVAYSIKYSPMVGSAAQAFASNPTPQTFGVYAATTIGEQRRLEPYRTPAVLPKQEMDRVGAALANARTAENGAAAATTVLQNEAQLTGRYWPQVANEMLHGHVINEPQFVAAQLFGKPGAAGIAQELIQTSMMKPEELETGNRLAFKDANKAAAAAVQALRQTLHPQTGGDALADSYQNSIASLLMSRAKTAGNTGSPTKDAASIARTIINGDYTFSGTLRIPNGVGDSSLIESGSQEVQADLKNHHLVVPPSYSGLRPGPQHDDYTLALQAHGQWVTNGDESGAMLLDPQGNQVTEIKDGKAVPLELKWADLAKLASPTARTLHKVESMGVGGIVSSIPASAGLGPL